MSKKFVLTENTKKFFGVTLYQIKAVRAFGDIEEGELGGWVEKEENLNQSGNAWVSGNALVSGDARVSGDAIVESRKHIAWFSSVGSEDGTLTAYTIKTGEIGVTRGCFQGTLEEFESKVKQRHNDTRYAEEYLALIQYIKLRFQGITVSVIEEEGK